jgi:hypothetical protein
MPMTRSEACWNPAVPPPPVAGAAVGAGLAVGLGVTEGDGLGVADGDGEGDGLVVVLGLGLALSLGEPLGELLGEPDAVADAPAEDEGEVVGSAPDDGDPEHADTVAETSTVKMPQLTAAASLALNLAPPTVLRTFMEPPHASGRKRRGP